MYSIKGKQAARIEPVTFLELQMTENDIEEILRNSIDMICDEEKNPCLLSGDRLEMKRMEEVI